MDERLQNAVLVLVLLLHLALLSQQTSGQGSRFERYALAVFGPLIGAVDDTVDSGQRVASDLRLASTLRQENSRLRDEVDELRRQVVRLQGVEEELERLSRLAGYSRLATGDNFVADVVYLDHESWLRTLVLYSGPERAQANQAVVTDRGLVGRILVASGSYAKVLLLTDRSAAASAMIQRTRRKGIVRGAGDHLLLENVPALSDVRVGDLVVTAGLDGVFPRGLPIGTVSELETSGGSLFRRIEVAPAVDFGLLDQVYVLTRAPFPERVQDDLGIDDDIEEGGPR